MVLNFSIVMSTLVILTVLLFNITGPTGVLIQQHHYQARPAGDAAPKNEREPRCETPGSKDVNCGINNNHSIYQVDGRNIF